MRDEEKLLIKCFVPPLVLLALMWIVKGYEIYFGIDLYSYGIYPRDPQALKGIITMPFIHSDLNHLSPIRYR